jgi:hypothetical protein
VQFRKDIDVPARKLDSRSIGGIRCEAEVCQVAVGRRWTLAKAPHANDPEPADDPVSVRVQGNEGAVDERHPVRDRARVEVAAQNGVFRAATTCRGQEQEEKKRRRAPLTCP